MKTHKGWEVGQNLRLQSQTQNLPGTEKVRGMHDSLFYKMEQCQGNRNKLVTLWTDQNSNL